MTLLSLILAAAACDGLAGSTSGPDGTSIGGLRDTVVVQSHTTRVPVNGVLLLHAEVRDEEGALVANPSLTWSSSDPAIVSVSQSGLVIGEANGTARVVAKSGQRSGVVDLSVYDYVAPVPQGPGGSSGALPAFPGADGWGATALTGCRSLPVEVLRVTNRDAEGPGSLADAVHGARSDRFSFIVFETGGVIETPRSTGIRLNSSCVYIGGQTAPGDGIVLQGRKTALWFRGGGPNISDIVIRYLRFRGRSGATNNNIIVAKGERVVLDHLSFSWTDNYILALLRYGGAKTFSAPIADVSIQNSIASEVFAVHPTGPVMGSDGELKSFPYIDMSNISLQRNLWAHNSHRNPMTAADNTLIANNVIYNWSIGAGMMNRRGTADWINNYGKAGPMTNPDNTYLVNPYCDELGGDFSIFAAGNISPMSSDAGGDNWTGPSRQVACFHRTGDEKGQEVPAEWRRDTEQSWRSAPIPVDLLSARQAFEVVLGDVGANRRLACDGTWIDALDGVDARVIRETREGSGVSRPPENESAVGGFPSYAAGTACSDADRDGLPDAWEQRFFACDTCAEPGLIGRDGYLLMEHYLNGTGPL